MKYQDVGLAGARLIIPEAASDDRGSFMRMFCAKEWAANRLPVQFVQHSVSHTLLKGTLRGLHYQAPPFLEVKVVRCIRGAIHDVIVDLRKGSRTAGQWRSFRLDQDSRHQLLIPAGFAHGFQTLSDNVEVSYMISEYFVPEASRGVRFDDPALAIKWPLPISALSEKDRNWPALETTELLPA